MLPAGAFYALKNTPRGFSSSQNAVLLKKHTLFAPIPTYVGICVSPFPQGLFMPPQKTPQGVFVQLNCCFGGTGLPEPGEPAGAVGGTGRSPETNRFLKQKVRTPKASLVGE